MFTADIDMALLAKVSGDAALKALMPDGVWWDVSPSGKTRIIIIKLMHHETVDQFNGCAFEYPLYLIKAVEYATSPANVINAAKRIDALLNNQPLTVAGYGVSAVQYQEYVHYAEPDSANPDARWQHCGAMYLITAAPN